MEGNHVVWADSWDFRVGFNAREGLVLHNILFLEHPPKVTQNLPSKNTTCHANSCNSNQPYVVDKGLITRNVLFRGSMCEMTVPYGDPRPQHFRKNAFDAGEYPLFLLLCCLLYFSVCILPIYGMGRCANSLKLGCDCKGLIHYFDAAICGKLSSPSVSCFPYI